MAAELEGDQVKQSNCSSEPAVVGKRKPLGWKAMPFILANETFEKVASFGVAANLTTFLNKSAIVRDGDINDDGSAKNS
ncbi:hypothetical protein PR202_gb03975 [Eleusine coracana subsp. coracana]|uniref:Uncharacterized protein n=1 Tax=Eleusine coracana subsp. coracana TaxID=191504 RepID=A0AAV5E3A8_ELECO|nr:hypothetical protein PR202_gb03975 [Eleusine coracana subsp. coracana]